ncbi:MAG: rhamnulokinase family protein [Candidatus Acidiferrales bacterium]
MSRDATCLAFDLGAESGRAIIGRLRSGKLSIEELRRFRNEPVRYHGGLHWDAPRLWLEMQAALAALPSAGAADAIDSIAVDTWGVDYALLGENGELLGNPHHYRDARTDGVMQRVQKQLTPEFIYRITGIQFLPFNTLFQLAAAAERTPRLLALAQHLVTMPDLFHFWMTGKAVCEYTNASTTQFLDIHTHAWSTELLAKLGIPTHFLSPLVEAGTVLGPLVPDCVARASSALARTVVVAPACHDTGSAFAAVHSGARTALLSSGTWSLLGTECAKPVVSDEALRLNFTNEGGVFGTIRLLKNITGMWLLESCRRSWAASHDKEFAHGDLLAEAAAAPPLRHLLDPDDPSFSHPPDMPAAIDAFCQRTGQPTPVAPGACARAVLESLALKYRVVLEALEKLAGAKFEELRIVGGGSQNDLLNQFAADATGRRVVAGPVEATALGNIAIQLVGTAAVADLAQARELIAASFPPRIFEPRHTAPWDNAYRNFKSLLSVPM